MTRLIDADRLKKVLAIMANECGGEFDILDVSNAIEISPTIERPHGEWIDTDVTYEDSGDVERRCSNCKHGDRQSPSAIVPYCWYCGASMSANDRQVTGKLNSEIEKSKGQILPDYRDGWRLKEGDSDA